MDIFDKHLLLTYPDYQCLHEQAVADFAMAQTPKERDRALWRLCWVIGMYMDNGRLWNEWLREFCREDHPQCQTRWAWLMVRRLNRLGALRPTCVWCKRPYPTEAEHREWQRLSELRGPDDEFVPALFEYDAQFCWAEWDKWPCPMRPLADDVRARWQAEASEKHGA